MIDAIATIIAQLPDRRTRAALELCLPYLDEAVTSWGGPALGDDPAALTIAAVTPFSAIVLTADDWLGIDHAAAGKLDMAATCIAIARAVESVPTQAATGTILTGLCRLLGSAGIAAQQADAERIIKDGGLPLCVALFAPVAAEKSVSLLVVTIAVPARTLH